MTLPPPAPEDVELPPAVNATAALVLDVAFLVHRRFGPGLLECVYRRCLVHGLRNRGATVQEETWLPLEFEGLHVSAGLRVDLLVNGHLIVEIKAVAALHPVHEAQLLSYLRLARVPLGLLLNFHVPQLRMGIRRLVNTRTLQT